MNKIRFDVKTISKLVDPYNEGRDRYVIQTDCRHLPKNINTKTNLRTVKTNTKVYKKIVNSLLNDWDQNFHLKNKGITISAKDVALKQDPTTKQRFIEVLFLDDSIHGIADGGHTYHAIISNQDTLLENGPVYVMVSFLTGVEEFYEDVSGGMNTNVQVKDETLENQKGFYEDIKLALQGTPLDKAVAYEENDPADCSIKDVLSLIECFDHARHDMDSPPISAYSSKKGVSNKYSAEKKEVFNMYSPIIPHLSKLVDVANYIEASFAKMYNSTGGKFGNCIGIKKGDKFYLKYDTSTKTSYSIPWSYILPAVSAMRCLFVYDKDTHTYSWLDDPIKVWDMVGPKVTKSIMRLASELNNVNATGKSPSVWATAYSNVITTVLLNKYAS